MNRQPKKSIKLALQGGGSHGAFTWGVLDQLLGDERIRIEAVSGTSAGAMNAVALADGMARGSPAEARKCLERFWSATSAAARYSPIRRSIFDKFMGNWSLDTSPVYILMDHLSRIFSPYDTNPMDFNPLRDVVGKCVDFDAVNDPGGLKVFLITHDPQPI
jgi:NTE family protein